MTCPAQGAQCRRPWAAASGMKSSVIRSWWSEPGAPAPQPRCCSPGPATTSSSSTGHAFPATPCRRTAIARGGVVQLSRWGLLDGVLATGAPPVREVIFGSRRRRDDAADQGAGRGRPVLAPRRHVLDALLARCGRGGRGNRCGPASRRPGTAPRPTGRVVGLDARTADGGTLASARAVRRRRGRPAVADGRLAWAPRHRRASRADTATFYTYVADVDWPAFEFHVAPDAFAGVFPTHDGEACVWLGRPTAALARRSGLQASAAARRWSPRSRRHRRASAARVRAGRVTSARARCCRPAQLRATARSGAGLGAGR